MASELRVAAAAVELLVVVVVELVVGGHMFPCKTHQVLPLRGKQK